MTTTPKRHSAYLVTWSDNPDMPVGKVLIDKGNRLVAEWTVMAYKTGQTTVAVGHRLSLLCGDCRLDHRIVGILGHDGDCGTEDVKSEGRQVLADAKKRVATEHNLTLDGDPT